MNSEDGPVMPQCLVRVWIVKRAEPGTGPKS